MNEKREHCIADLLRRGVWATWGLVCVLSLTLLLELMCRDRKTYGASVQITCLSAAYLATSASCGLAWWSIPASKSFGKIAALGASTVLIVFSIWIFGMGQHSLDSFVVASSLLGIGIIGSILYFRT